MKTWVFVVFVISALAALASTPAHADQTRDVRTPEVKVTAEAPAAEEPNALVGTYHQPRWTAMRSFGLSRTYVIPEGTVGLEYWMLNKKDRAANGNYFLFQKEIEVGLGHGLQLDFYLNDFQDFGSANLATEGQQYELRWALAEWGKLLFNPTLYFEYHAVAAAYDKFEFRLLLGDTFATDWRWTVNFGAEQELYGPNLTQELAVTAGVANQLTKKLMLGMEAKNEYTSVQSARNNPTAELYLAPSVRYKPVHNFNLLFVPSYGVNNLANRWEIQTIAAIDFE